MLNKVAYKIAKKIVECSDADKEEIYIYGLELIISTFFGLVSILLISCLLSRFTSGLVFISVFVPLRLFTGGFHAATYNRCFVISNISYLLILFVRDITLEIFPMWTWLFLLIGMCCYIIKNAPIVNSAQPINEQRQKHNKKMTKYALIADIAWIICLAINQRELMVMAILSIFLITVLMMISDSSINVHSL
jgi:accessory gene regulator B